MSARLIRIFVVVAAYAVLVAAGNLLGMWGAERIEPGLVPVEASFLRGMIFLALGLYVLLLAIPFVPGVEIGLGLIAMLGPEICLIVYIATVAALSLSFLVGRLLPERTIVRALAFLHLARARDLAARLQMLAPEERLAYLKSLTKGRLLPALLKARYLGLAVILNLPGNALVGGGGGIALAAGMSRLMPFPAYLLTVALAVAPVPLAVWLMGGTP
jgi:hypothetical protein